MSRKTNTKKMKKLVFAFAIIWLSVLFCPIAKGQHTTIDTLKVTLAGHITGKISKDDIINSLELKCSPAEYEVSSFVMIYMFGGKPYEKVIKGNQFKEVNLLKRLKSGDKLYFESIKVIHKTSEKKTIIPWPSLSFIIQ